MIISFRLALACIQEQKIVRLVKSHRGRLCPDESLVEFMRYVAVLQLSSTAFSSRSDSKNPNESFLALRLFTNGSELFA